MTIPNQGIGEYHRQRKSVICEACGFEFVGFITTRYCSERCRQRARNRRRKHSLTHMPQPQAVTVNTYKIVPNELAAQIFARMIDNPDVKDISIEIFPEFDTLIIPREITIVEEIPGYPENGYRLATLPPSLYAPAPRLATEALKEE